MLPWNSPEISLRTPKACLTLRKKGKTFFLDIKIQIIKNQDPSRLLIQKINIYSLLCSSSFTSLWIEWILIAASPTKSKKASSIYIILCSFFSILYRWVNKKKKEKKKGSQITSMKRVSSSQLRFFFIWEVSTLFNTFQFTFICSNGQNLDSRISKLKMTARQIVWLEKQSDPSRLVHIKREKAISVKKEFLSRFKSLTIIFVISIFFVPSSKK